MGRTAVVLGRSAEDKLPKAEVPGREFRLRHRDANFRRGGSSPLSPGCAAGREGDLAIAEVKVPHALKALAVLRPCLPKRDRFGSRFGLDIPVHRKRHGLTAEPGSASIFWMFR